MDQDDWRSLPPNKEMEKANHLLTEASRRYCDAFPLRAAIQLLPGIGGALDALLSGLGAKYEYQRLEDFLCSVHRRLERLERQGRLVSLEPSEELYDFVLMTLDKVRRIRSWNKRRYFANLLVNQVQSLKDWDEAGTALGIMQNLTDNHIEVLQSTRKITESTSSSISTVSKNSLCIKEDASEGVFHYTLFFPGMKSFLIKSIASDLSSMGLLFDNGVGALGVKAMEFFRTTSVAEWFLAWLTEGYIGDKPLHETHLPVLRDFNDPPEAPEKGERFGIMDKPTGAWHNHPNGIAEWDGATWLFTDPQEGMIVYNKDEDAVFRFNGTEWISCMT